MLRSSFIVFLLAIHYEGTKGLHTSIPSHLLECYEDRDNQLPLTIDVFIGLIRKIETSPYFLSDMGTLVEALLDRFWRDGIVLERKIIVVAPEVIPYKTSGFESYKYGIISKFLLPQTRRNPKVYENIFGDDVLSLSERCTLHHMLSRSVDIWERGNEFHVCEIYIDSNVTDSTTTGFRLSSCPVEKGVVSAKKFGTISLSHVLIGIATALKPMQVPMSYLLKVKDKNLESQYVNNQFISIVGDLSEVLLMQTPVRQNHYVFGPGGKWNDSDVPAEYFMTLTRNDLKYALWQFTNAEILGAFDGLMMGEEALTWAYNDNDLKLSQLLEGFYSGEFSEVSIRTHACMRPAFVQAHLKSSPDLAQQLENFSEVHIQEMPNFIRDETVMKKKIDNIVKGFNIYSSNFLSKQLDCPKGINLRPRLEINLILDNSWTPFESLKFVTAFGAQADVSQFGSRLSLIKGDDGLLMIKRADFIGDLYLAWSRVTSIGIPTLPESLITLRNLILYDKEKEQNSTPFGQVTIIVGLSTIISESDIVNSMELLKSVRKYNPDMVFIYVTSRSLAPMYVRLTSIAGSQNDRIIAVENNHQVRILTELAITEQIPRAIRPRHCRMTNDRRNGSTEIKDFANPGSVLEYRIHPCYLVGARHLTLTVENEDKGNLVVCMKRDENSPDEECKEATVNDRLSFALREPCPSGNGGAAGRSWDPDCLPVFIRVSAKRSFSTCTEARCRMPDDIPFTLVLDGMKCITDYPSCTNSNDIQHSSLITILLLNVISFFYH